MNNKGADQTAGMLVCAFVVRKQQSQGFSRRGPYDIEAQASWPLSGYAPVLYMGREFYLLIYKWVDSQFKYCPGGSDRPNKK